MRLLLANTTSNIDPDVYRISVLILILIMAMAFIIAILRAILEHKLKNRMLEKGISETLVASMLQKDLNNTKYLSMKWVLVLLASGVGLFITKHFLPLGIHSIGIMAISISLGFIGYVLYLNRFAK